MNPLLKNALRESVELQKLTDESLQEPCKIDPVLREELQEEVRRLQNHLLDRSKKKPALQAGKNMEETMRIAAERLTLIQKEKDEYDAIIKRMTDIQKRLRVVRP